MALSLGLTSPRRYSKPLSSKLSSNTPFDVTSLHSAEYDTEGWGEKIKHITRRMFYRDNEPNILSRSGLKNYYPKSYYEKEQTVLKYKFCLLTYIAS